MAQDMDASIKPMSWAKRLVIPSPGIKFCEVDWQQETTLDEDGFPDTSAVLHDVEGDQFEIISDGDTITVNCEQCSYVMLDQRLLNILKRYLAAMKKKVDSHVSGDETGDDYGDSPDGHVTSLGGSNT